MRNRLYEATTLIRQYLLSNEQVRAELGTKIFPIIAPDNTDGDFVTLTRIDYERARSKQGIYSNAVALEVAIVSDDYDRGISLARLLDDLLEDDGLLWHDPTSRIIRVELLSASEDYDEYKYIQYLNYEIQYQ